MHYHNVFVSLRGYLFPWEVCFYCIVDVEKLCKITDMGPKSSFHKNRAYRITI